MKKLYLGLVALAMFAGYSFAEEAPAADVVAVDEEYAIETEFFKNLNGALEVYNLPAGVKTFSEVYELLSGELQKVAEENPELLKGMIEKYGQETANGEKVVSVPLYFYIKG